MMMMMMSPILTSLVMTTSELMSSRIKVFDLLLKNPTVFV